MDFSLNRVGVLIRAKKWYSKEHHFLLKQIAEAIFQSAIKGCGTPNFPTLYSYF